MSLLSLQINQDQILKLVFLWFKVKLTGLTEQVCTPTPGDEDVVKTDDPYSSDQDGCACTDPSIEETCHCLVGYGGTGAVCSRKLYF